MNKKFALRGINDDTSECSICGRVNLKQVMWIVELGPGGDELSDPFPCGTTCGAKMLKITAGKMRTRAKNYECEVYKKREALKRGHPLYQKRHNLIQQMNDLGLMGAERFNHPLMEEMREVVKELNAWGDEQVILVEL